MSVEKPRNGGCGSLVPRLYPPDDPHETVRSKDVDCCAPYYAYSSDSDESLFFSQFGTGLEGVEYGALSEWMPVVPGGYYINVANAGAGVDNSVVDVPSFELPRGQWTTIAVIMDNEDTPAIVTAIEDFSEPLPGASNVTFFNALSTEDRVTFCRDGVIHIIGYVIDPTLDQEDYDLFDDAVNLRLNADDELTNEIESMTDEMEEDTTTESGG